MATLKFNEIKKMNKDELGKKMKELKFELVKSKAGVSKTGSSKSKEIRKIIARINTFNNQNKNLELKNK